MNYIFNVDGGGIFSKYMLTVQKAMHYNYEGVYINITDTKTNSDMFSSVLNQEILNPSITIKSDFLGTYTSTNTISNSNNLSAYKRFVNTLKFKESFMERVEKLTNDLGIDENTVGVHLRLTDMNTLHSDNYGVLGFQDYANHMKEDVQYFVASDNDESIGKLKSLFGDNVKSVPDFIRCENEVGDSMGLQLTNFRNHRFWEEAFIDMLLLSKCGKLIHRTSNLANAAIIHSNTINEIIAV